MADAYESLVILFLSVPLKQIWLFNEVNRILIETSISFFYEMEVLFKKA